VCVKPKKPSKILKRRLFHAEVKSFNKQKLVFETRVVSYVLSLLYYVAVITSVVEANLLSLDMSGGLTPASRSKLVAGNKFELAEN
jgi:hypothetical protein